MHRLRSLSPLLFICGLIAPANAQDKKLTREQLPARVLATVDRETHGSTITGYATETEHGRRVYEVETIANGHSRDLQIAADGTVQEVEEEVPMASLPAGVQAVLHAKAKGATITKVESLKKHGTLVAYEASTIRNGHKGEVQVGPNGETLSHEE